MQFFIPTFSSDPNHLLELAKVAEDSGWHGVAVSDHVVYLERMSSKYPYTHDGEAHWDADNPWPDPWVAIGAMAAATERIRFLTNVFVLPARNPVLTAKAVSTAAVISGGRVALGVGVGWMREEFDVLAQDFRTRGKRTDEAIEILRLLWSGAMVEYHGKHYDFPRLQMSPAPTAPIPILVGGLSDPALRRAARCDGWISVIHTTEEIGDYARRLARMRAEQGLADDPFEIIVSPTDVSDADGYRRLRDVGATGVILAPWLVTGGNRADLESKRDGIRRFADDVILRMER